MFKKENKPMHYGKNSFINPYLDHKIEKGITDVFKMHFDDERIEWEGNYDKVPFNVADSSVINIPDSNLKVTWIGNSSFLVQKNGINILTDPVFSHRASPVSFAGPERVHPPGINKEHLPAIDIVLISHDHYDHLDINFVKWINNRTKWIVPLGLKAFFLDLDIFDENIIELDWYGNYESENINVTATPTQHFSGRKPWGRNKTLWCSYAVIIDDIMFWFGGDTGYNDVQFREIGEKFKSFDLALIPIGAYKPRWFMKDMHVNPEEAVLIHKEINSKFSIAGHWGTFKLSSEGIDEPVRDLKSAKIRHGLVDEEFIHIGIGETKTLK
ncbi:MAG: MBL fold metallo-hydrolase [Candidatus Delongbacteria bacterium]|nr:MBL fold metallo-hydrolase [Candidatus Delongbacteria bacterium]